MGVFGIKKKLFIDIIIFGIIDGFLIKGWVFVFFI